MWAHSFIYIASMWEFVGMFSCCEAWAVPEGWEILCDEQKGRETKK